MKIIDEIKSKMVVHTGIGEEGFVDNVEFVFGKFTLSFGEKLEAYLRNRESCHQSMMIAIQRKILQLAKDIKKANPQED